MKTVLLFSFILACIFLFSSCRHGYKKKGGQWAWVTYDESVGERVKWVMGADPATFEVLEDGQFAKDKAHVYFQGRTINQANPNSFRLLNHATYSMDEKRVFLDAEIILDADPATFEILAFPYARDKSHLFNGTIPMITEPDEIQHFRVTNEDPMMAPSKTTTLFSHFLEMNPEYHFLSRFAEENRFVITGDWGTGESHRAKYKGRRKIAGK